MARIAVVDDHTLVRESLVRSMRDVGHVVTSAGALAELPDEPKIDLVLLDLDLGAAGLVGEQEVTRLTDRGVRLLIVSALGSPRHVRRVLRAGAVGVVSKMDSTSELVAAVEAALRGELWMSRMWAQALAVDDDADRPTLSDQELQALRLYACGLKLDSVARRMGVAPSTAKQYIDRVREKYARAGHPARTKAELYGVAVQDGFITEGAGGAQTGRMSPE